MEAKKYDIIVIGAGSGGLNIVGFMRRVGFKVLLIDKTDKSIGGDCLNFGCVPSKALIHTSRLAHAAKRASEFGLKVSGSMDLKAVSQFVSEKKEFIRQHENATYFRKLGVDVALGTAKFVDKQTVSVNDKHYSAKRIIIATGSRPRQADIAGMEKITVYTNETIFSLEKLPKSLVILGAGPIGCEIGQAFSRLGTKVHFVVRGNEFLVKEDPAVSKLLLAKLQKEGVTFHFDSAISHIEKNKIFVETGKNRKVTAIDSDSLLVAIGRQLNIENLGLEKAGVELREDGRGLVVNSKLQTTNKNIFVCGDVVGGPQFTHVAEIHASIILSNFFSPFKKKVSYDKLAWVTFTDPEIATFGLNEQTLKLRNYSYRKIEHEFTHDDRAIVSESSDGKLILFVSKNKILGGSMIAENAGELVQELILAQNANIAISKLFAKVYPYPTASRVNKSAIATLFADKLTPMTIKILRWLY